MTNRQIQNRNKIISKFGTISVDYTWEELMNIIQTILSTPVSENHKQYCLDHYITEYYFKRFNNECCYGFEISNSVISLIVQWDTTDYYDPLVEHSYLSNSKGITKESLHEVIFQFSKTF